MPPKPVAREKTAREKALEFAKQVKKPKPMHPSSSVGGKARQSHDGPVDNQRGGLV